MTNGHATTPLLLTKILIPPRRASQVVRTRLSLPPAAVYGTRLVLVSAPAGFGKTTLLADWARELADQAGYAVAWYALDPTDNEPSRFVIYLLTALAQALGDAGTLLSLADMLCVAPHAPVEPALTIALNTLAQAERPLLIVLDDYHTIATPAIDTAVDYLLAHLPEQVLVAIGTRADPVLSLTRLRVHGQLVELRAADLRFTTDETRAYFANALGIALRDDALQEIDLTAEGWAAGLQLLGISLARHGVHAADAVAQVLARFGASQRHIFDYLAEEVFVHQPPELRRFLLDTAVLDRMCAPLCDAVMSRTDDGPLAAPADPETMTSSQTMLEYLEHNNLFVTPLDEDRHWYRYHHLFVEFLRDRLVHEAPARFAELHRRAARWYAGQLPAGGAAMAGGAIHHALVAGEVTVAADLVERVARQMVMDGELATLRVWVESLPAEVVRARPQLSLATVWAHGYSGEIAVLEQALCDAETGLAGTTEPPEQRTSLRGEILALRAVISSWRWDAQHAIEYGRQALLLLSPQNTMARAVALQGLGSACRIEGAVEEAIWAFREVAEIGRTTGSLFLTYAPVFKWSRALMMQGQLREAGALLAEARETLESTNRAPLMLLGEVYGGLADVAYRRNELDRALEFAQRALSLGQQSSNTNLLFSASLLLARLQGARGAWEPAAQALHHAETIAPRYRAAAALRAYLAANNARLQWLCGDIASASAWADQAAKYQPHHLPLALREFGDLTLARIRCTQGQIEPAQALLAQAQRDAEAQGRNGALIEILAIAAIGLAAQGKTTAALSRLEASLTLAAPEGYLRVFLDEGPPMAALLRAFDDARRTTSRAQPRLYRFVQCLLEAFGHETAHRPGTSADAVLPSSSVHPLVEPLSERELEVLHLIAGGAPNGAIAEQLVVSVGTVKSHVNHILGKLGAHNRTEAVARARAAGLLRD